MEVHAEEVCVKVLKELLNLVLVSCGQLDPAAIHDSGATQSGGVRGLEK